MDQRSRYVFPKPTPYLLDTYEGAAAAYSLRRLRSAYTGPAVRVRRESNNDELDIYFDGQGNLDTASLEAFCAGTNGFVKVWYDQSGNGNDATQDVATANQPQIVSSGSIIPEGGKPAIEFDGSDDELSHNISGLENGDFTYTDVFTSSDGGAMIHSSTTNNKWPIISQTSTSTQLSAGFVTTYLSFFKNGVQPLSSGATRTDLKNAFFDGNQNLAFWHGTTDSLAVSQMYLGRYQSGGFEFTGKLQETILWTSDQNTAGNRTGIETNINDYYNIY
jgi:hypothetical protein